MLLLLLATLPDAIPTDRVDVVEINHVWSGETGARSLSQVVFWDLCDDGLRCRDWRIWSGVEPSRKSMIFWDRSCRRLRRVRYRVLIRTHSTYDPELQDRDRYPMAERRELR